jgi:dienelactone hydrolase
VLTVLAVLSWDRFGFLLNYLEQELNKMEAAAQADPELETRIGRLSRLFGLFDNDQSGVVGCCVGGGMMW